MKIPELLPPRGEKDTLAPRPPAGPLHFTREEALREARKLHRFRDDLKARRSMQDTVARTSLGRDD